MKSLDVRGALLKPLSENGAFLNRFHSTEKLLEWIKRQNAEGAVVCITEIKEA